MTSEKKKKALYIVVSILIAIVLWAYVNNVENPDSDLKLNNVPLTLVGEEQLEDRGLLLTGGEDTTVDLKLIGKRDVLYRIDQNKVSIRVDLTDIREAGSYELQYDVSFGDLLTSTSVSVEAKRETVVLQVGELAHKSVDVRGEFSGSVADGFVADAFIIDPAVVELRGEAELVDAVSHALVVLTQENVSETIRSSMEFKLIDRNGKEVSGDDLQLSVSVVDVTLPIVIEKDVPLDLTLVEHPGSRAKDVTYTITPKTLRLSGEKSMLESMEAFSLATLDLSTLTESQSLSYNIMLPDGLKNASDVKKATVEIRFADTLQTHSFTTRNISLAHVTAGYEASLITKTMDVEIRGTEAALSSIDSSQIRVEADLTDINQATGRYTVPAKAYLSGAYEAGPVGIYRVVVELKAAN